MEFVSRQAFIDRPCVSLRAGGHLTLSDFGRIVFSHDNITFDATSLERLSLVQNAFDTNSINFSDIEGNSASCMARNSDCLGRCIMVCLVNSLVRGQAVVRAEFIQLLISLINSHVHPCLYEDIRPEAVLVCLLLGRTEARCIHSGVVMRCDEAFNVLSFRPLTHLMQSEYDCLVNPWYMVTGLAAGCCYVSRCCSSASDAVASLSCEALGVSTRPFAADQVRVPRLHRGQMTSAANLRLLLEGSSRCKSGGESSKKKKKNDDDDDTNDEFDLIPHIHGPVHDAMDAAVKSMEIELNSGFNSSVMSWHQFEASIPILLICQNSASTLKLASDRRLRQLNKSVVLNDDGADSLCTTSSSTRLTCMSGSSLDRQLDCVSSLSAELNESIHQLNALNDEAMVAKLNKEKRKMEALAKREAEIAAGSGSSVKLRQKDEPVSSVGLVIGVGSSQVWQYLLQHSLRHDFFNNDFQCMIAALLARLGSGGLKREPKTAKGTQDFGPDDMRIREFVFRTIRNTFKRHGGVEIDTPVFELKDTLLGKYGDEGGKLIYDLADQGGELLSLRYDLTVPFARYLAMNNIGDIKRYHIAKVYRRDNPVVSKGRFREFYQCDFDIAGIYAPMAADAEVIAVACEILKSLPIGSFQVKLNHRKILDAILDICGVPPDKFRSICSSIDKLDKEAWIDVRREMVEEKGLMCAVVDRIGEFVQLKGNPYELLHRIQAEQLFGQNKPALDALDDMNILFSYLQASNVLLLTSFDLSLARGLDYYTGLIYEIVLVDSTSQVGSIAAGGRYDHLVGMFSTAGDVPCVGVSMGVERIFTIMKHNNAMNFSPNVQVFVASIGEGMIPHRFEVAAKLWAANISAEFSQKTSLKLTPQLQSATERQIPFVVVFGETEVANKRVKLKDMTAREEVDVDLEAELIPELLRRGCKQLEY